MLHFKKTMGIFFCISLLVSSCTNENDDILNEEDTSTVLSKELLATATMSEKLAYKEFHLTNLMEKVLEINPNFNELEQLKSSKEEQPQFYIENLLKVSGLESKSDDETSTSLGAFTDLEGETWYPVLRIIEDEGSPVDGVFLVNSYNISSEKEISKAYKLNNGELELFADEFTDELYDSLYTSGKASPSLLTIELALCPPDENFQKIEVSCGGSGGGGGTTSSYQLKTINIKDKKESKWERADIHEISRLWGIIENNVAYVNTSNVSGVEIRKVRNSELNEDLTLNRNLVNKSSSGILQHIIFEHDNFPAQPKSSIIPGPNGTTFKVTYRSWQSDYNHQLLSVNRSFTGVSNISNFSFDDGNEISYEIR